MAVVAAETQTVDLLLVSQVIMLEPVEAPQVLLVIAMTIQQAVAVERNQQVAPAVQLVGQLVLHLQVEMEVATVVRKIMGVLTEEETAVVSRTAAVLTRSQAVVAVVAAITAVVAVDYVTVGITVEPAVVEVQGLLQEARPQMLQEMALTPEIRTMLSVVVSATAETVVCLEQVGQAGMTAKLLLATPLALEVP